MCIGNCGGTVEHEGRAFRGDEGIIPSRKRRYAEFTTMLSLTWQPVNFNGADSCFKLAGDHMKQCSSNHQWSGTSKAVLSVG